MKTITYVVIGAAAGCVAASLFIHRRVIAAAIKGEPLPEPPEWHKAYHPCFNKE